MQATILANGIDTGIDPLGGGNNGVPPATPADADATGDILIAAVGEDLMNSGTIGNGNGGNTGPDGSLGDSGPNMPVGTKAGNLGIDAQDDHGRESVIDPNVAVASEAPDRESKASIARDAGVEAKPSCSARVATHVASTVGPRLAPVDSVRAPHIETEFYLQATDALAAEALDASDGAYPTIADAIEVGLEPASLSGSSEAVGAEAFDATVANAIKAPKPGSSRAATVEASGVPSHKVSSIGAVETCGKPGFQPTLKAPLAMHIQAQAKRFTVTPSETDSGTHVPTPVVAPPPSRQYIWF